MEISPSLFKLVITHFFLYIFQRCYPVEKNETVTVEKWQKVTFQTLNNNQKWLKHFFITFLK